jgi:UDP-N-acetylglucosamine 3-dehydrogenase
MTQPASGKRTPLTLTFLGCGHATRIHAGILARSFPDVRCRFASRELARARLFAREFGGDRHYESYEDALDDGTTDVVLVATPPSSHLPLVQAALRAGKHVIVEKPAFLRAAEVTDVETLAGCHNRTVLVAENYSYKPIVRLLQREITAGAIGEPLAVELDARKHQRPKGWRADPALAGGGALFESGVHWIRLLGDLGGEITKVTAITTPTPHACVGGEINVHVLYKSGATGIMRHSWLARNVPRLSRVRGSEGTLLFESHGLAAALAHGRIIRPRRVQLKDLGGYQRMLSDFVAELRGERQTHTTLQHARRDLELIEDIYRHLPSPPDGSPSRRAW